MYYVFGLMFESHSYNVAYVNILKYTKYLVKTMS